MAHDDFERLHELVSDLWRIPAPTSRRGAFRPNMDVFRTEDPAELTVVCELAGVDPDDVQLIVHEGTLYLAGERRRPCAADRRVSYHRVEVEIGRFERAVALPADVDVDAARATFVRGLLTITFPVAEAAPPAPRPRITISVVTSR